MPSTAKFFRSEVNGALRYPGLQLDRMAAIAILEPRHAQIMLDAIRNGQGQDGEPLVFTISGVHLEMAHEPGDFPRFLVVLEPPIMERNTE